MSHRNVVLVTVDSLRADHCSSYGYDRETSPNLDALAAEGLAVLFALHDLELATRYADRLVFLADGEVVAVGGPEVVTSALVAEVYDIHARVVDVEGHRVVLPDP